MIHGCMDRQYYTIKQTQMAVHARNDHGITTLAAALDFFEHIAPKYLNAIAQLLGYAQVTHPP
jgi:hypothetical protein